MTLERGDSLYGVNLGIVIPENIISMYLVYYAQADDVLPDQRIDQQCRDFTCTQILFFICFSFLIFLLASYRIISK